MFRFENMTAMYLLLLIPLLGLVWYWAGKKRKSNIATFSNPLLFDRLQTNKTTSHVRFFWWLLAILLLIFALANPQLGAKREKAKVENIDIIIHHRPDTIQKRRPDRFDIFCWKCLSSDAIDL